MTATPAQNRRIYAAMNNITSPTLKGWCALAQAADGKERYVTEADDGGGYVVKTLEDHKIYAGATKYRTKRDANEALRDACIEACAQFVRYNHEQGNGYAVICDHNGGLWGFSFASEAAAWKSAENWAKEVHETLNAADFTAYYAYAKVKLKDIDADSVRGNDPDVRLLRKCR